jgi:hypothetical protein
MPLCQKCSLKLIKISLFVSFFNDNSFLKFDQSTSIFGVSENSFEQTQLEYESFNLDERSSSPLQRQQKQNQQTEPKKLPSIETKQNQDQQQQPQPRPTFNSANNSNNFLYKAKKKTDKKKSDDFVLV